MNLPDLPGGGMTISSSSFSSGRSLDASTRYMGMIELSTYKKTRNALFQLFDYVASESPSFFGLHAFITVWRVLQFFGRNGREFCRFGVLKIEETQSC